MGRGIEPSGCGSYLEDAVNEERAHDAEDGEAASCRPAAAVVLVPVPPRRHGEHGRRPRRVRHVCPPLRPALIRTESKRQRPAMATAPRSGPAPRRCRGAPKRGEVGKGTQVAGPGCTETEACAAVRPLCSCKCNASRRGIRFFKVKLNGLINK